MSHSDPRGVGVGLPFFIQYDGGRRDITVDERRARAAATGVELTEGSLQWVEVGADADVLAEWVGDATLDIRVSSAARGLQRVGLRLDNRDAVIE